MNLEIMFNSSVFFITPKYSCWSPSSSNFASEMCLKSTFLFFWTASVSLHQFLCFSLCHLPCYKSYPNIRSALVMVAYCSSYNSRCTNELSRMFHSLQRCSSLSWSLCSQPRKHWPLECVQTLLCLQSDAK